MISITNSYRAISEETRKKLSVTKMGERNPNYGKTMSDENRKRISNALKEEKNPFFGRHHTEETKRKISEKNTGRVSWNKGISPSLETRRKSSISHMGICQSPETIRKRSQALTGLIRKPISERARQNMSRAQLGRKVSDETRAKMRTCSLNEAAFDVLTEDSAYWIGMIIADGNVSDMHGTPRVALHLKEIDKDHIDKKFRNFVSSSHKLGCYVSKRTGRIYYSLSFTSERIAKELRKYGIVPQKTFTVKVRGELENNRHTWRGIIDGDGHMSIYLRKTPIGIIRAIPYISLTGSLQVCLQFKNFLENTLSLPMPNIISSKKSYSLSIFDHRALRAIKLLYENCTMALERKLATARKIMNSFEISDNSRYIKRRVSPDDYNTILYNEARKSWIEH
jgi:hypothetical protein